MRLAMEKAAKGVREGQTPFGACIVKNNKVIGLAHNLVWKNTDITAHAEITVIRSACRSLKKIDLTGCTIYSTCEPCPMCFCACHWAKISRIVFGASIRDAKRFGFNELEVSNLELKHSAKSGVKISSGILKEENIALFEFWKERGKGKVY